MAASQTTDALAHWNQLIENFHTSPREYYDAVEQALDRRRIPGFKTSHVRWSEGGLLSPNREYLRVTGDRYRFDVCAAPFGSGVFFSTWMTQRKAKWVLLHLLMMVVLSLVFGWMLQTSLMAILRTFANTPMAFLLYGAGGMVGPFLTIPSGILLMLWSAAMAARMGVFDPELVVLSVPILSAIYQRLFAPDTYYRIDTQQMFNSAVQAAVRECINNLLASKGRRALPEETKPPVHPELEWEAVQEAVADREFAH